MPFCGGETQAMPVFTEYLTFPPLRRRGFLIIIEEKFLGR